MSFPLLQPTAPTDSTTQWVLIGLVAITVLFTIFRPALRRKDPLAKGPPASLSQQRAVEREMQNLLVELSEMARQISAQLDTRAAKLELLIREADEKIAAMKSLAEDFNRSASRGQATTDAKAHPNTDSLDPSSATPQVDPRHSQIYELADQGCNVAQIAQRLERPSGEVELILALRPKS